MTDVSKHLTGTVRECACVCLCERGKYLIIFNSLSKWLHIHSFIQLIPVQQINEEVQGTLVHTHLRVKGTHTLIYLYITLIKGTTERERAQPEMNAYYYYYLAFY